MEKPFWKEIILPAIMILLLITAGGGTGYWLARQKTASPTTARKIDGAELIQGTKEAGIKDEKVFRDSAQGKIAVNENGTGAEGSHKLIRPGGVSQTAYLTSSAVDLNQYLGKCVEVWGETFSSQKAGWFMDIGLVKILDSCPEGI